MSTITQKVCVLLAAAMAVGSMSRADQTQLFDAVNDFSITSNPNGVWSYGWTASLGSTLTLFTAANPVTCGYPYLQQWTIIPGCPDNPFTTTPGLIYNGSDTPHCKISACQPPGVLNFQPDNRGGYVVARWTAPRAGSYRIEGVFEGLDYVGPTTSDVHVLLNSTESLLSAPITSYLLPISFTLQAKLKAGDIIDFAVGYGSNRNYYYDSTGGNATITREPD
jgi:hypothetical protein